MTIHRILDLLFYATVNYIAYIPLVVYPFRNKFTFSKKTSYLILAMIALGFYTMIFFVDQGLLPSFWIPIISLFGTTLIMYIGIREHLGKTLMTFLIEYNNASFVTVMAKNLEILVFPERTHELYCYTHSIFIFIGLIIVYIADGIYTFRVYDKIINSPNHSKAWNYLWLTPMSYYVIWFVYIYSSDAYMHGTLENPLIIFMLILFSCCSFITYYILIRLVYFEGESARLEYQDELNQAHYQNMHERIEETRRSRHDLRHHFLVLSSMSAENDIEGIRRYLSRFDEKYENYEALTYCQHFATNAALSYYKQKAKDEGIDFEITCHLPSEVQFSEKDLTIIFGNLIENAIHACEKVTTQKPWIKFVCRYDNELILKVSNASDQQPVKDDDGRYFSSSHKGHGTGIESVKHVVNELDGMIVIHHDQNQFEVMIQLPLQE